MRFVLHKLIPYNIKETMCGICYYNGCNHTNEEILEYFVKIQHHGPDSLKFIIKISNMEGYLSPSII